MYTEAFSSQNTFPLVKTTMRLLFPNISSHELGLIHAVIRKAGHVIECFILGLLLFFAFRGGSTGLWKWRWSLFAITGVVLWAMSDEWHQSFVPTRMASVADVGIDVAGGILAQFVGALFHRYTRK
jgi:VanZ family protein